MKRLLLFLLMAVSAFAQTRYVTNPSSPTVSAVLLSDGSVVMIDGYAPTTTNAIATYTFVTNWVALHGGGSQTPWTSDIDAAGYNLTNAGSLQLSNVLSISDFNIMQGPYNDIPEALVFTNAISSGQFGVGPDGEFFLQGNNTIFDLASRSGGLSENMAFYVSSRNFYVYDSLTATSPFQVNGATGAVAITGGGGYDPNYDDGSGELLQVNGGAHLIGSLCADDGVDPPWIAYDANTRAGVKVSSDSKVQDGTNYTGIVEFYNGQTDRKEYYKPKLNKFYDLVTGKELTGPTTQELSTASANRQAKKAAQLAKRIVKPFPSRTNAPAINRNPAAASPTK